MAERIGAAAFLALSAIADTATAQTPPASPAAAPPGQAETA